MAGDLGLSLRRHSVLGWPPGGVTALRPDGRPKAAQDAASPQMMEGTLSHRSPGGSASVYETTCSVLPVRTTATFRGNSLIFLFRNIHEHQFQEQVNPSPQATSVTRGQLDAARTQPPSRTIPPPLPSPLCTWGSPTAGDVEAEAGPALGGGSSQTPTNCPKRAQRRVSTSAKPCPNAVGPRTSLLASLGTQAET